MYGLESYEKIKKSSTLGSKQILTYDRNQGINLLSHEGNSRAGHRMIAKKIKKKS